MDSQISSELQEDGAYVALTHHHLDVQSITDRVRSPQAGAIVLFAGEPLVALSCRSVPSSANIDSRYL